jgi:hypothetical protein
MAGVHVAHIQASIPHSRCARHWEKRQVSDSTLGRGVESGGEQALAHRQAGLERTRVAVKNISLTKNGVVPLDPGCPSFQEAQLGPCWSVLNQRSPRQRHESWFAASVRSRAQPGAQACGKLRVRPEPTVPCAQAGSRLPAGAFLFLFYGLHLHEFCH